MPAAPNSVSEALGKLGKASDQIRVSVSNAIVKLFSDQLYASPLKAIEELVVNSYDAMATTCRLYVPPPSQAAADEHAFVVVFDNGCGMDPAGLHQLWHIGQSNKRDPQVEARSKRKLIGKFGIGKLATSTISNRLTHISRTKGTIHSVTIDFRSFEGSGRADDVTEINLPLVRVPEPKKLLRDPLFLNACNAAGISEEDLEAGSWTFAILEDLKEKVREIQHGRLAWVLRTAMPLQSDFRLFLNKEPILSSKDEIAQVVSFSVHQLPADRISDLNQETRQVWKCKNDSLVCTLFPSGIKGHVAVYERSLLGGKSDDLMRSHGFFVRVRGRLVNLQDPLFGMDPVSHTTFSNFRADVDVDDLDDEIKATRERFATSSKVQICRDVLRELFNYARSKYQRIVDEEREKEKYKSESKRQYVSPRLVELPLADVLAAPRTASRGADADDSWFYLNVHSGIDLSGLVKELYSGNRGGYSYDYDLRGPNQRLVQFDPTTSVFRINESHPFVRSHMDDARARDLLHDVVTAEVMLEVYLREAGIEAGVVGDVLERRDSLLRGLASDHTHSFSLLAAQLRDATPTSATWKSVLWLRYEHLVLSHSTSPARESQMGSQDSSHTLAAKRKSPWRRSLRRRPLPLERLTSQGLRNI